MAGPALLGLGLQAARAQPAPAPAATPASTLGAGTVALPTLEVEGRGGGTVQGFVASDARTSTKTDTPILEVPQSVSVVTRDELDARQVQTVGEALRYTPGVRGEPYGPDNRYDWFFLRGFQADTSSVFLNGLRYHFGNLTGMLEPYGMERIEVLRGPASVLYGQIAPGGVVNLVSRRPTEAPQNEVRLSAGNFDRLQAAFTSSGKLDSDGVFSYSVTGLARDSGTQVDEVKNDRYFIAPALTWRPSADTKLTLLSYYQRDATHGDEFLPALGTVYPSVYGRIPTNRFTGNKDTDHFDRTQYGIGYELEHRFDQVFSVRQNVRYAHTDIDWYQTYGLGLRPDQRTLNRYAFQAYNTLTSFQVDNQGEARFATGPLRHTVLAGFDYANSLYASRQQGAVASPIDLYAPVYSGSTPALSPLSNSRQAANQFGLYLQDQIRFDRWALTVGLRQDWVDTITRSRIGAGSKQSQDDGRLTWRAGLVYLADNGLAPYVSYATSFQPQLGTGFFGQTYVPTTGEQYEVGVKYQPPGSNSFAQLALFHLTQQNVLTTDPNNALNQVQTGEIRVRGVEAEGVATLSRGLSLRAAYTYLDPEITQSNVAAEKGKRPNGIPMTTAGLYADYAFDPAAGRLAGLGIGAGIRFQGNTPAGNAHALIVPSVTLVDAALRYDLAQLSDRLKGSQLALNVSNLFDTEYVASCGSASSCFWGLRRTIIGSLVHRW
ncbi:TonB-dependent siderophore receptor [Roseicella frigidaeris]|nr:TonB-dependent siderophore receptor [Roseicella frigidaeris]